MNYVDIAKLVTDPKERVIIIEEGKPAVVVMGLEAYQELKGAVTCPPYITAKPEAAESAEIVNIKLEEERIRARDLAARLAMEPEKPAESAARVSRNPEPAPSPVREPEVAASDFSRIRLEDLPL